MNRGIFWGVEPKMCTVKVLGILGINPSFTYFSNTGWVLRVGSFSPTFTPTIGNSI
jgi:hypothetical protein